MVTVEQPNLYAISVSWQVQTGDVFGVYQPDLKKSRYSFAMQDEGGELSYVMRNQRRARDIFDTSRFDATGHPYPLVNVEAGRCTCCDYYSEKILCEIIFHEILFILPLTHAADGECVSGVLNLLTIITKAKVKSGLVQQNTLQLYSNSNKVRIFPAIRFGCNGRITRALFAAEPNESTLSHAELQLWSKLQIWFLSVPGSYNRRNQASLEGATATSDLNVYEKTFSQPLRFEAGDILGLYLPPEEHSSLQLFLQGGPLATNVPSYSIQQSNSFSDTYFNTNNAESDYSVPLLSLKISKFQFH